MRYIKRKIYWIYLDQELLSLFGFSPVFILFVVCCIDVPCASLRDCLASVTASAERMYCTVLFVTEFTRHHIFSVYFYFGDLHESAHLGLFRSNGFGNLMCSLQISYPRTHMFNSIVEDLQYSKK